MDSKIIFAEIDRAQDMVGRLNAYAEVSHLSGAYTEENCARDASMLIVRLVGLLVKMQLEAASGQASDTEDKSFKKQGKYCGHCGKEFVTMMPGTRCRTPHCEAGAYWDRQKKKEN